VGSIALWWIYFDSGAERAHHRIASSADPGRQARIAYTYLHVLIVAVWENRALRSLNEVSH